MVFELKRPQGSTKGVVVFTHKERRLLEGADAGLRRGLEALRARYVILMHWGWYHEGLDPVPHVDAHLAGPNTIHFKEPERNIHIPLCSRDFLPPIFRPLGMDRSWDVLTVARPVRFKHLHDMLLVCRRVLDTGVDLRARFHCPVPARLTGPQWDRAFLRDKDALFSPAERERIRVDLHVHRRGLFPLGQEAVVERYNSAKAFALFTKTEGESRVLHEALLCGTPVVARRGLRGGGLDHLVDGQNAALFDDLDQAVETFAAIAEGRLRLDAGSESLRAHIGEAAGIRRLESALEDLFERLGERWEPGFVTDDLMNRLPSHRTELPRSWTFPETDDLRTLHGLHRYIVDRLAVDDYSFAAHLRHHVARPAQAARRGVGRASDLAYGLRQRWRER